ncbi:MAG: RNA 2',3'-cyclic phosphodiesterase [Clostridiales bacterium]|jgi:2'-5' RNA ligase|nr:RNA 2',3'-cyclic phosphodiesterase [Clostridiales bacterium]
MRLFIAINFDESTKKAIQQISYEIKRHSLQGRFVKEQHLHLTLEFLGNIHPAQLYKIKDAMNQIIAEKFIMKLKGIGFFKGRDGHIYWIGIEANKHLINLQKQLHEALKSQGFTLDNRPYKPHITIGRRVKIKDNFLLDKMLTNINQITVNVDKIDLMNSEHISGKLVYSILYTRKL